MANLRYIRINATGSFDGTTVLSGAYVPEDNAKQPLLSITQAAIGRLSFAQLLRPGSVGGLARIRTYGLADATATLRSLSTTETAELATPDDPPPIGVDVALKTIALTSEWSVPVMAGPSDALAFSGHAGTIEMAFADANDQEMLAFWNAEASRAPEPDITFLLVTTNTVLTAWSGDLYVQLEPATAGVTLTLPAVADMVMEARLHLAHTGGSWGRLLADGSEQINGGTTGVMVGDRQETLIELIDEEWTATEPAIISDVTITNAASAAVVTLPVIYGRQIVSVNYTAYGDAKLPPIASVPVGATYILQRTGDSAASPPEPARCRITVDNVADTLDGVANAERFLGPVGSTMRIDRAAGGWITEGNRPDLADQVFEVTGTTYTFRSGWVGTKYVRSTNVGATTIDLPPAALTPVGCRVVVSGAGVAGYTLASADVDIFNGGVSAATAAGVQYSALALEFNGTNWLNCDT